jgi:RNA polymerase sigma-70 factor, ECF subfamily
VPATGARVFGTEHHQVFRKARGNLFGYAFALTGDAEAAADLLQDCIVRAMSSRKVPTDERAVRSWLFRILRNLWIDRMRACRRQDAFQADLSVSQTDALGPSPEDVVVNRIAVRQAFLRLSKDHRDVLALVDIGGFSYEEASEILDVPRGTIMSRVSRARLALSSLLSEMQIAAFPRARKSARHD